MTKDNKTNFYKSLKDTANDYEEYIFNWINNNFSYSLDPLHFYMMLTPNLSNNPDYLVDHYICEHGFCNKQYSTVEDKKQFFDIVIEKVYKDIIKIIEYDYRSIQKDNILHYLYQLLLYNRYLGIIIVNSQNKDCLIINDSEFFNVIFNVMNKDDNHTRVIEQHISTQEDALELLIKIIMMQHTNHSDGKLNKEIDKKSLFMLLTLSHTMVILVNTKQDLTIGINKKNKILINELGEIIVKDAFEWNKISLSNYDRFHKNQNEIDNKIYNLLNNDILNRLGFNFDDYIKLKSYLERELGQVVIIYNKDEWINKLITIGILERRATKLFEYFLFSEITEGINLHEIHKYLDENYYQMFSNKVFVPYEDNFICYISQAIYALEYFYASVFNRPNKFVNSEKIVDKISNAFCLSIKELLTKNFDGSQVIVNLRLSQLGINSNRELDVLFIINNKIFVIECKRLKFPENNGATHKEYARLAKDYSLQLKCELSDFKNNYLKVIRFINENRLARIDESRKYNIEGLIITKEFSPVMLQNTPYKILHID